MMSDDVVVERPVSVQVIARATPTPLPRPFTPKLLPTPV